MIRNKKKFEYRSLPTNKWERVYVYASLMPGGERDFKDLKLKPGDLPTGVIIGMVEIVNCTGRPGDYEWHLANPERLDEPIKLEKRPQPVWFIPF